MAKMVKKAQNGIVGKIKASFKKAGEDLKQADRDYKSSDSVRNLPIKSKSVKGKLDEMRSNRAKADSLFKVAQKREMGQMKKGGKMIKKAKNGTSFGMLSVKAGVDSNPKATFADKIAGAKKMAKSGKKVKKAQYGVDMTPGAMKMGGKAAKQAAIAIAMKKAGKAPKKASYGKMMKSGGKCKNGC